MPILADSRRIFRRPNFSLIALSSCSQELSLPRRLTHPRHETHRVILSVAEESRRCGRYPCCQRASAAPICLSSCGSTYLSSRSAGEESASVVAFVLASVLVLSVIPSVAETCFFFYLSSRSAAEGSAAASFVCHSEAKRAESAFRLCLHLSLRAWLQPCRENSPWNWASAPEGTHSPNPSHQLQRYRNHLSNSAA